MRFLPLTWGSSPVKASSLKTLADMTKYLRCHHVLQTNPCISTCCSWGHRRVKQNKTLWIKACLWKSAAVCEKGVMWEKASRSSATGGEDWEGIRRGRELCGAFYALTMQTPCSTIYSDGSSLWWLARRGEATKTGCLDTLSPWTVIRRISIHIFPSLIPHFWDFLSIK